MPTQSNQLPRVSREELKDKIDRGERLIIVDARDLEGYNASDIRPKDSVRIAPGASDGEVAHLPKDKLVITA